MMPEQFPKGRGTRKSYRVKSKPAFREEEALLKDRSFSEEYRFFRESGLGRIDALYSACYVKLCQKSVDREKERLEEEGREAGAEQLNEVFPPALRALSALPRLSRSVGGFFRHLWHGLYHRDYGNRRYRNSAVFIWKHIPHVLVVALLVGVISYVGWTLSTTVVMEAQIDGVSIGAVENTGVVDSAVHELEDNVTSILGRNFQFPFEISYTFTRTRDPKLTEKSAISEILYSYLPDYICTAAGLYVDDVLVAVCEDGDVIRKELDSMTAAAVGRGDNVGILNEIMVTTQAYPAGSVMDRNALKALLAEMAVPLEERESTTIFQESEGQDLGLVSGTASSDTLLCDLEIPTVRRVRKSSNQPQSIDGIHLQFYTSEILRYQVTVPYATVYVESKNLYSIMEDITTAGVNGKTNVEAKAFYVNGQEVRRDILSETVVSAPVNQVVTMGIRILPEELGITGVKNRFILPANGTVNYGYGEREDGMHRGWDIPKPEGSPIYAAASGKVITAIGAEGGYTLDPSGLYSGYGYCVLIEHEDGYSTMYAHCSKVLVEVGQEVKQGEIIAEVGQTGLAQGNHVHFEIWQGRNRVNPADGYMYEGTTTLYDRVGTDPKEKERS